MPDPASRPALRAALADAQRLGFLGPGPLDPVLAHAASYAAWCASGPLTALDLGSGGGVPGLVLAVERPDWHVQLLDGSETRCSFLRRMVHRLELTGRVEVLEGRVEDLVRSRRASVDVVVARGFGPPASTAECAAPFLRVGGRLVVSAARDQAAWDDVQVDVLGLRRRADLGDEAFVVLDQVSICPARFPRRSVTRRTS